MKVPFSMVAGLLASQCYQIDAAVVPSKEFSKSPPYQRVHPRETLEVESIIRKRAGPPLMEAKVPTPSKGPVRDMIVKAKDFASTKKGRWIIGGMAAKAAFSGGFLYYMQQNQNNHPRGPALIAPPPNTANQQISLTNAGGVLNFSSSYASSNRPGNSTFVPDENLKTL